MHDTLLGENVAPFRILSPRRAVIPISDTRILPASEIATEPGLSAWWEAVEGAWMHGRKPSERAPLLERFDYHNQLSAQLPAATHRVVYTKSGNTLAAAHVADPRAVIDHKLYWTAVSSPWEAAYLAAVLNSEQVLERVKPFQTQGLFGARDFDKYVLYAPIPTYDPNNDVHRALAKLGRQAEDIAAGVPVPRGARFQRARTDIRRALADVGIATQIESAVRNILNSG